MQRDSKEEVKKLDSQNSNAPSSLRGEAEVIHELDSESTKQDSRSQTDSVKVDCHENPSGFSRNDNEVANNTKANSCNDNAAAQGSNAPSSLRGEAEAIHDNGAKSTKQDYYFVPMQEMPKSGFAAFKRSISLSIGSDIIKGLGLTLKEFFSKPVTMNYPFEMQPLSPRYRAVHNLQRMLESGNERCIGCGLCEKICTSNCIRILTHEGEDGRKKIDSYTINLGRCIYCGLCAEVCPELAIVMGNRFENASEQRAHFGLKEDFLKDLEEAKCHQQLEFEGFGSVRPSADKEVKQTPLDY